MFVRGDFGLQVKKKYGSHLANFSSQNKMKVSEFGLAANKKSPFKIVPENS